MDPSQGKKGEGPCTREGEARGGGKSSINGKGVKMNRLSQISSISKEGIRCLVKGRSMKLGGREGDMERSFILGFLGSYSVKDRAVW